MALPWSSRVPGAERPAPCHEPLHLSRCGARAYWHTLCGGGSDASAQQLDRLLDVWPGSLSTDIAGDNRGDWLFIGEGGTVAIVDMNGITAASDPLVHNPFDDPGKVKRARCGPQGVRPIALLLDPDADLKVDTGSPAVPQDGNFSNDREDVLYIAGGVMGLWAMRAETTIGSTAQNVCVRIDDSPDNVVTNQTSRRHCNQLEVAVVDGRPYLLATFGEHLLDHYDHGLVQSWRFTNLPRDNNQVELGSPSGRRRGSSNLPFIVLPDEHTCAWRIRSVTIEAGAQPAQVLLFVADFGGHLYVYDISDLPDQPRSSQGWSNASNLLATWDAPLGVYETFPSNVRALAVDHDPTNPDAITVDAGVPGHGIEILTLARTSGTTNWAFAPTSTTLETPGEPRDIEVRNEPGLKKLLLVSDGASGWRIYGE